MNLIVFLSLVESEFETFETMQSNQKSEAVIVLHPKNQLMYGLHECILVKAANRCLHLSIKNFMCYNLQPRDSLLA